MKPGWDWELFREESWHPGVKPVGSLQYYVYGVVEPGGDNFFREISHLDTVCFQEFLNDFRGISEDLHIIQLDGSFHTTPKLKAPKT